MLCCFPKGQGRSPRTPRRESTWQRVRGWIAQPRCFRPLGRNLPTAMGSAGQVSPAPAPRCSEMNGSPEQVSLGLAARHLEPLSPEPDSLVLASTIGNQAAEGLAEVCTARTEAAGTQCTTTEPLEQAFVDSCPIPGTHFPDPMRADTSSPEEAMVGRSTSDVPESSLELHCHEDPPAELALQEHSEPTEAEPEPAGPAPAQAEVPPVEPAPAPPAAPSPALASQREPASGSPCAPAAGPGLLVAPQQGSAPELPPGPAPAPPLPFPSITVGHVFAYVLSLLFWIYMNNRILFNKS
ncbi:PREDICTED: predicted GPI-anchored protein 58 isoform X2 [Chinchilla lanigera]|uniref:predicted GPI-anchored protein 58 isoform X2 n=1 Tax=Chinchilla lanigera TaxID=34839 RepID=UPI00038EE49E|nr:PREDICTED: predicted GPI-anchored protein 58 isoform X2 [Chinchilla lanigera]